jgi:hypothetical protein
MRRDRSDRRRFGRSHSLVQGRRFGSDLHVGRSQRYANEFTEIIIDLCCLTLKLLSLFTLKGTLEQARTITAPSLEGRAYFNLHNRPAFLQIDPIRLEDAGDYRCRVDFKKARTVNTVISLKVIGKLLDSKILNSRSYLIWLEQEHDARSTC